MLGYARVKRAGTVLLVVGSYVIAIVALTWPLASLSTTHLPRTLAPIGADMHLAGWALAWQTHALTTDPARFLHANVYWPAPRALLYGTPGFGLLPPFAPIFLATGNPTLALNGALLLSLALTAASLHLVTVRWTGLPAAGIAAGFVFLFSPMALAQVGLMPQYAALAALPLVVGRLADGGMRWPGTIGLAALVAFQSLTDVVYVGPPLFLTIAIAVAVMLCDGRRRLRGRRILFALGIAACMLAPLYLGYLSVWADNPDLRRQTVWPGTRVTNLPFLRTSWLPSGGPLALDEWSLAPAALGLLLSLGGLGGATAARWRAWRWAGLFFAVGFTLSWGVPLFVPSFRAFVGAHFARDLLRFGSGGLIGACLLTGLGFAACAATVRALVPGGGGRLPAWILLIGFLALVGPRTPAPLGEYPVAAAPVSGGEAPVLRAGRGPVLVLPIGRDGLGSEQHASAMYRSIDHWRPLLNGYASYYPSDFAPRMALALRLPDPRALDTLRRETGLTTVAVESVGRGGRQRRRWADALRRGALPGVSIAYEDPRVLVLEIRSTAAAADDGRKVHRDDAFQSPARATTSAAPAVSASPWPSSRKCTRPSASTHAC